MNHDPKDKESTDREDDTTEPEGSSSLSEGEQPTVPTGRYYYDDATGYQTFDPDAEDEDD